ncbi:uncharacterized protein LOC109807280 [Cajanus cajan]|uniref:uncharacterized protein LOC109807280 n=1 Tax=Cajanus cajan TaxID=3821 RepID=UPI00098DC14D|nr:uncharacterized protein LOC109807280 [Cajanus cajan]
MECILAVPAQKEVKKPERNNKEVDKKRKRVIEHDLERNGNEIGIGNTKTNYGKRTSKKLEKVPKVSPYFRNGFEEKGVNGEDNRDEIAIEKMKSKRKRRLKKHGPQGDYEKKVDAESCCYGSKGNGDEIAIEKIKSKRKRRSHEPQGDIGEKIPHESCYYGCDIGFVEDKLLADGKIKSKEKKRRKVVEDELRKNGDDAETNKFILKMSEPLGDNKEKNDRESCCYGCKIGFSEEKLLEDGKIKSKDKKKKKKAVEDKLREHGGEAETSKFILKKHEPQSDNKEKIDPELCCYGCDIGFVEDKLLADGKVKSKEKKKKKKLVEDKLREHGDDNEISKFILKKHEPQGDSKEKNDPESCCFGCNIAFVEEKLLADGKIKSKDKKKEMKKKKAVEDKLREHGGEAEFSKFIRNKHEPQGDIKEKIDPELCCYGCDIGFVEDKMLADGKIKSKEKKKKKLVDDELWEHDDDAEISKFILKKREPQGNNKEKNDPESCCYGCNMPPELCCCGCDIGFVEDKLLADRKIKFKEKKKKVVEDDLQKNGDDAETNKFILKKHELQGDKEKNDPESCIYGCNVGFVEEKLLADGKNKSKEKKKMKKRVVEDKLWGHGGEAETSKFILKHEPLGGNNEKIDPELCCYGCDIGFVEDKLLADGKIKSKEKKKKKLVDDELWENDDDAEISKFILKKREPQGNNKEKNDPESCCYGCNMPPELCCCGCDIGVVEDKLLADQKIKFEEKKKKVVEDELQNNGDDAETNKFMLKKHELQGDKEKNDSESCIYGCNVGFVEEKLLADGKNKSKEKKKMKKKVVEDKLWGHGGEAETSKFILKHEPLCGNNEKIDPELCCYGCDIGFVEDKLLADGMIKSKEKKKKKLVDDELWENDDDAEISKFILKKREPQGNNKEKNDPESCCYGCKMPPELCFCGCDIGFVEDKLLADRKIKFKEKKKKVVEDELQKNGDDAETNKFILKKHELQGDKEKNDPESCIYGCNVGFVEEKLLADGKNKSKEKKKMKN